jgi:hypothetical protein
VALIVFQLTTARKPSKSQFSSSPDPVLDLTGDKPSRL